MSVILGLNAFHAGAAAALIIDGQPVAAIAEERLNRRKYYANFPTMAVRKCLEMGGVRPRHRRRRPGSRHVGEPGAEDSSTPFAIRPSRSTGSRPNRHGTRSMT